MDGNQELGGCTELKLGFEVWVAWMRVNFTRALIWYLYFTLCAWEIDTLESGTEGVRIV